MERGWPTATSRERLRTISPRYQRWERWIWNERHLHELQLLDRMGKAFDLTMPEVGTTGAYPIPVEP